MKEKYIDLTHPIYEGMMTYPRHWHPKVEIKEMGRIEKEGRASRKLVLGTHTGTHIDAPTHFLKDRETIDQIGLDVCIGPATLIDLSSPRPLSSPRKRGSKHIIDQVDLEQKLDGISKPERLIIRFGWSKQFGKPSFYQEHPSFTEEACHWLVRKGVRLLGIDTPSPDHPCLRHPEGEARGIFSRHLHDSPNHKIFLGEGVFLLEYLCHLEKLRGPDIFLMALPLKILGADGAPARVVAYDR